MKSNERMKSGALDGRLFAVFEKNHQMTKVNAQNFAQKGLPAPLHDRMGPYFEEDHFRYQHLLDDVNKELQFKTTVQQVTDNTRIMEEQLHDLSNKHAAASEKLIEAEHNLNQLPKPKGKNREMLGWLLICILCGFEGILSQPAFERFGYPWIVSLLLGLLFGCVLGILAYFLIHIVSWGKTIWQRRLIVLGFTVFLTVLFRYLAGYRAEYLNSLVNANGTDSVNIHFSPWPFVLISLLLFAASVAIKYFVIPGKKERQEIKTYHDALAEKQALERDIENIEAEKVRLRKENNELRASSASILEYGCMLEESVITNARSAYALFKKHNLMHRSDKLRPDCFEEPYPFEFTRNFHIIKNMNHEITN